MNLATFDLIFLCESSFYCVRTFYWLALDLLIPFTTFATFLEPFILCYNNAIYILFSAYYFSFLPFILFKPPHFLPLFLFSIFFIFLFFQLFSLQTRAPPILTTVICFPLCICSIRPGSSGISTLSNCPWRTFSFGLGKMLSPLQRIS